MDYNLYGEASFTFSVIVLENDPDKIDEFERFYIAAEINPYNIAKGGAHLRVLSEEERNKRRYRGPESHIYQVSDKTRAKMVATRTGQPYTRYSKNNVVTDDIVVQIKQMLIDGTAPKEVAARLGIKYNTVNNILSNDAWSNIEVDGWTQFQQDRPRIHRLTYADACDIRQAYNNGTSVHALVDQYGTCIHTIRNILAYRTFQ